MSSFRNALLAATTFGKQLGLIYQFLFPFPPQRATRRWRFGIEWRRIVTDTSTKILRSRVKRPSHPRTCASLRPPTPLLRSAAVSGGVTTHRVLGSDDAETHPTPLETTGSSTRASEPVAARGRRTGRKRTSRRSGRGRRGFRQFLDGHGVWSIQGKQAMGGDVRLMKSRK